MESIQKSPKKPSWIRMKLPGGKQYSEVKRKIDKFKLHTVCEQAKCPNVAECWGAGTAAVMILGSVCTRGCRFCGVIKGKTGESLGQDEPERVANVVKKLGLKYVVLTSVDRDDLNDGGAGHFAKTVECIKKRDSGILVEVLIPDFNGEKQALERIISSGADVIGHNIETVERLTSKVRDKRCGYDLSLSVLKYVKESRSGGFTKSSIMVGLGETSDEVLKTMDDLRLAGVDILTIGQYLCPTAKQLPVAEYLLPEKFVFFEQEGMKKGFRLVFSGPLVRSSYRAGEKYIQNILELKNKSHSNGGL